MGRPHVLTMRELIRRLPERLAWHFAKSPFWDRKDYSQGGTTKQTVDRLLRLDLETCTPKDVLDCGAWLSAWMRPECRSCQQRVDEVVVFGWDAEEDGDPYEVCRNCLRTACEAAKVPLLVSTSAKATDE